MKQIIENIIKKNLPAKQEIYPINVEKQDEKWNYLNGFNQALSEINISLIADEVLKVVENIKVSWDIADGGSEWCVQIWNGNTLLESLTKNSDYGGCVKILELLSNPSPHKENKN
jgi:hypothetical protein